jgi:hypothetical protein
MPITIQGHEFEFGAAKYAEGHVVTANEANALNQVRLENIRNNTAAKIKKAADEAGVEPSAVNLDAQFGDEAGATLRSVIQAYADNYEFGARAVARAEPIDPIEREAMKIAKETVRKALSAAGHKIKDLDPEKVQGLYDAYAAKEETLKEAKRRVKLAESIGAEAVDLSALGLDSPESEA